MIDLLSQDFVQLALIAGCLLAIPLGILGCFTLWQRMTFFGDAMGHAAISGVALGTLIATSPEWGVLISSLIAVVILAYHKESSKLPLDTWLGAVSYGGLALGLVILSKNPHLQINPETILFGEIFATTTKDIVLIAGCAGLTIVICALAWRSLLVVSINEDLARGNDINVTKIKGILFFLMAITTAVAIKIVGGLMLPALLIFPAASSTCAKTPEHMVIQSVGMALIIFILGLLTSLFFDLPCAPSIVLVGTGILIASKLTSFK
ncbi:MAG: metal ABC transporter permease [Candidatus Paracaedibacteraceae bacterium]|nr:metal ABC transporter permease [Candidatus Paracaedibacteraceae bacterium]